MTVDFQLNTYIKGSGRKRLLSHLKAHVGSYYPVSIKLYSDDFIRVKGSFIMLAMFISHICSIEL